ncbi:MMPL family transporter [Streptomyces boncukensis]|uniref:MMPL family transporter n=1 Tax=Streptomyces boncukensis TaxID=2711219 RepID=A0A6G4WQD1_9ACTN|nr:MMPL family transporter [Streptomyces boncukensis]NGO67479.1 MMPL family transporter [Streptomyces boncukensis]
MRHGTRNTQRRPSGLAGRLGGWSTRHRKTAIFGWLLFVVVASVLGGMAGLNTPEAHEQGTGNSGKAQKILDDAGIENHPSESVMVTADAKGGWQSAAREVTAAVKGTGEVRHVRAALPSDDGKSALIGFEMKKDDEALKDDGKPTDEVIGAVDKVRDAHRDDGVEIYQTGAASGQKWLDKILGEDFAKAEWTAVPLALGILLVAFGALVAALLPVALAVTAFVAANGLVALASTQMHIDEQTTSVMLLMGLAVGVDYCLFYLRRERDERARGRDSETALRVAAETSGRAVLVSGLTVMVAMAGMFLSGLLLFKGFALATITVVLIAMLGSVTILPALLSWLGDRVEKGKIHFFKKHSLGGRKKDIAAGHRKPKGRFAGALLRPVLAAPGVFVALGALAMLALAAPALGMKTEQLPLEKQMASDAPLRVASEKINETFPGGPAPATVVVKADQGELHGAVADFTRAVRADQEHFGKGVETTFDDAKGVAVVDVPLRGSGTDDTSKAALDELRDKLVPEKLRPAAENGDAYVMGELASSTDFNDQLTADIAPILAFITVVTFLLMLVCFRSVPIALVTILLNLLSVGAAYGVMTAVFQHGVGTELLGTEKTGAIEAWMPLFILVVLFGLSMDYHVFVVSRIREARERGMSTREAIRDGIRATAGAVTSAAVIMVAVFSVFATLSMTDMKQMGVGLAVAVLLDATLVRMVLLPAAMMVLGERCWSMPKWLGWLPEIKHGSDEPEPGPAPAAGYGPGYGHVAPVPEYGQEPPVPMR